jgi:membrane protein DedA with SNARE-associated domain
MNLSQFILDFKYPAIFIGSIIEGPFVIIATGFFINQGHLHVVPTFIALLLGDIVADFSWYGVGYQGMPYLIGRIEKFVGLNEKTLERIRAIFRKHGGKILIASKMTMGFGFGIAVLMTAGAMRMPLGKYGICSALGASAWIIFLLVLGQTCGTIYEMLEGGSRIGFLLMVSLCFLYAIFVFSRCMKKRMDS